MVHEIQLNIEILGTGHGLVILWKSLNFNGTFQMSSYWLGVMVEHHDRVEIIPLIISLYF